MTSSSGALLKHWTSREEFFPLEQFDAHQRCSKAQIVSHRRRSVAVVVWYWIQVRSRRLTAWIWNCQTLIGRWRNPSAYIKTKKLFTVGALWLAAFKPKERSFCSSRRSVLTLISMSHGWLTGTGFTSQTIFASLARTNTWWICSGRPVAKDSNIGERTTMNTSLSLSLVYLFESLDEDWEHERRVSKAYSLRWYNE